MNYGHIYQAKVYEVTEDHAYAQVQGRTFEIVGHKEDRYQVGEEVEGVIYQDRFGKDVLQTDLPDIRSEIFGWGEVQLARRDLGVFVDVGFVNKDVVVSLDDLPFEKNQWPQKGDRLFLTYEVDDQDRFWGKMATPEDIAEHSVKAPASAMNIDTTATAYRLREEGTLALTADGYLGFLHASERFDEARLGECFETRIINVRQDGGVNLSVKPRAHEAIGDDASMILAILERTPNNYLPLHDRSSPDDIRTQLGISKGQFKRAVGNLLKAKRITQEIGDGIYLVKDE